MRVAFKEWAVVVNALERGEQSLILRKGGIVEGRGGFRVEHPRFFFFPTQFHQQRAQVRPEAQARFDELAPSFPVAEVVRIQAWAEVVAWRKLTSLANAERLRGQHIWRDEVIADRFEWGREQAIYALVLRVYRLPWPWTGPMLPSYAGCKSWIELGEEISTDGSTSALNNTDFTNAQARLLAAVDS